MNQDQPLTFSSKIAFLLSVLGIAIGTGNIWRFPRIVAQNSSETGAGAFLFVWVVFLFLWSIPLIIGEYAIGRRFGKGLIGSVNAASGGKLTWIGAFMAMVATAITFFYSVVVGWCIYYFIYMAIHPLAETAESAVLVWDNYQNSGWPLVTHAVALGLGCLSIMKGVSSIERINKILIPSLLVILAGSAIRALTLEGSFDGIVFLFTPDWSLVSDPKIWIEALTQNAWDTGAGWGLFLTYAAYMTSNQGIVKNAFFTGIGNNLVSLLAAIIIFGTVFSILGGSGLSKSEIVDVIKTSGPASTGLTFIWMPQLFAKMFGGGLIATLFFLGLTFAGLTSLIAQLELPTRVVMDFGTTRKRAIVLVAIVSYVLGIPSAINLNILSNQDFVWGVALMLSGVFFAYLISTFGIGKIIDSENNIDNGDWKIHAAWKYIILVFVPLAGAVLVIWFLADAASVSEWYHPFRSYSLATCLVQWTVVLATFILLNRTMNNQINKTK